MIDVSKLPPEERKVIEARREYQRKWRAANKDKVAKREMNFYKRYAEKISVEGAEKGLSK